MTEPNFGVVSFTLEEVCAKATRKEMAYVVSDAGIVFISDTSGHTKHIYKKGEDGKYSEMELNLNEMALRLAEGLDKVEFMKDVLQTMPVEQVLQLKELLPQPETTVKSKRGCFNLVVEGTGKRVKMVLR